MQPVLNAQLLIEAYSQGLFPMAYSADSDHVQWLCPEERGQLPILDLHIAKSLKKTILKNIKRNASYIIKINTDFEAVIRACAQAQPGRPETWINEDIIRAYCDLHAKGYAHSVECWDDARLVGGLYGVSIGGAFFGESMFSVQSNTSKIALVHLCARLHAAGYKVLDTQFVNDHLKQFGVYEVSYEEYMQKLAPVLDMKCDFLLDGMSEAELIKTYFEARKNSMKTA